MRFDAGRWGAILGAIRWYDFPRQANGSGQADGDHASSRTDPDGAERLTGIYGPEGWGFESLRARTSERASEPSGHRPDTSSADLSQAPTGLSCDRQRDGASERRRELD